MITYQVEKYADVINDIWPMLERHYLEVATDKGVKPLDPQLEQYESMEAAGILRIYTARYWPEGGNPEKGQLVAYFISFVIKHMHYQQTTVALNDIMYVDPDYRNKLVGYRLIKGASDDLKILGADILIIHMKVEYPFRSLLAKLGFHLTEENWEMVL